MATVITTTPAGTTEVEKPVSIIAKLIYPLALLAAVSIWFLAIRAPLWLDETLAYWQVSSGFAKVWSRSALMPSSIGYLYTLWFVKSILGSSEIALKIPSTLAMLGAVYFLFRSAHELYDHETAFLACIFFALTNNVVFAATDARPYAFALLASNLATFAFIRWMAKREMRQAIAFGAAAAGILYFHYLFGAILPVFAIYYLIARRGFVKEDLRQLAAVIAAFTLCSVPLIYRIASLYHTKAMHVVQEMHHPVLVALNTLAPLQLLIGFVIAACMAALIRKLNLPDRESLPAILFGP
ncbi:MAG: glycosyltransferase family 39 protein, partial [Candidatus Sulfotelmatobacter sp.]